MATGLFDPVFGRGRVEVGDDAWLRALLDVEAALARAVERAGLAPAGSGAQVTEAAAKNSFDPAALGTDLTGNPVPGLARALSRQVPETAREAVHKGATSQDIMDSAAMLLARRGFDVIEQDAATAADAAADLARAHRGTVLVGRTLLQQAVPVTFGLVAAGWLTGLDEARAGLARVRRERLAVQFGGAAGTLASLGSDGPRVATLLAQELGLTAPVLPWHTDRLRIIDLATALARVTAVLGKIARDITLHAQSEVGELREGIVPVHGDPRGPGGKVSPGVGGVPGGVIPPGGNKVSPGVGGVPGGVIPPGGNKAIPPGGNTVSRGASSAMPHKNNPVAALAILGCTKQVPGLVATLISAAEQEYQRGAGAWHSEWEPVGALLRLTGSAASWGAELLGGLVVDGQRMAANLAAADGLPLAEHVTGLLAAALGRVQAHDLVARASERAVSAGMPLRDVLLGVPELADRLAAAGVTAEQVEAALEPAGYVGAAGVFIDAALAAHVTKG